MPNHTGFPRTNASGIALPTGLYDPAYEHDSCGVGFVARITAEPDHSIVEHAVSVLVNLEHRGAIGGDKSTGDGAGLLLQIPDAFFRYGCRDLSFPLPPRGQYAAGLVFLPTDADLADRCVNTLERHAREEGCPVLGWRHVPVNADPLGELARMTRPAIRQCFLSRGSFDGGAFERKLYVIRRLAEKEVGSFSDCDASQFYIPSLSSRTIVYKGLLTGSQLTTFFPDLRDPSFASAFAVVHQRYSTNTLPTWHLAHPYRFLAHNGEINTLRGNINRMRAREAMIESELFGDDLEKIKPVIIEEGSDSAIFDNALELLVMAGRSLPHAMMMMVPEAFGPKFHMSEDKRAFYEYHSAIMEPWDGPAALVFSDGRYIGATLDRNGLRPARYTITRDGMIVMASETGVMDFPASQIFQKGRLQPGKMFLVDLEQKRIVPDNEIKSRISRQRPYRHWVKDNRIDMRGLFNPPEIPPEIPEVLVTRQIAFGYTEEDLKMVIAPMASQGQEAVGSMGDDSPLAVLSTPPPGPHPGGHGAPAQRLRPGNHRSGHRHPVSRGRRRESPGLGPDHRLRSGRKIHQGRGDLPDPDGQEHGRGPRPDPFLALHLPSSPSPDPQRPSHPGVDHHRNRGSPGGHALRAPRRLRCQRGLPLYRLFHGEQPGGNRAAGKTAPPGRSHRRVRHGRQERAAQNDEQDGDLDPAQLRRGPDLRGRGPRAEAHGQVLLRHGFPDQRDRAQRDRRGDAGKTSPGL